MATLGSLGGVPLLDFSPIGKLPQVYEEAQSKRMLSDLGKGLASGELDYRQAAGMAAEAGKLDIALSLIKLGQEKSDNEDFRKDFKGYFNNEVGPSSGQSLSNLGSPAGPPTSTPAPSLPTRPTSTTWGDKEGEDAGIYPPRNPQLASASAGVPSPAPPAPTGAIPGGYSGNFGGSIISAVPEGGEAIPVRPQSAPPVPQQQVQLAPAPPTAPTPPAQRGTGPMSSGIPQNPATADANRFLMMMVHPGVKKDQFEALKLMAGKAMDDAKLDPDQKGYMWYRTQETAAGRPPMQWLDYQVKLKQAGATSITTDMRGENEFEKEMGKDQAKRWSGYIATADQAQKELVDINNMRNISRRIGTQGVGVNVKEALGPYADALKIPIEGLSDIQAYSSIITRLAPQQRVPGSGSTSDIEYKGFVKAMPGLAQNPVAREMTIDTMEALKRHSIAEGEIASRLATKEINRGQAERELRAIPDPMIGFRKWKEANPEMYGAAVKIGMATPSAPQGSPAQQGTPTQTAQPAQQPKPAAPKLPVVSNQQEFKALDSGTLFVTPDGGQWRKP